MPRLLGGQPVDRTEQAVGRGRVAAVGAGAAGDIGAADDGQLRVAVDDHPVVADPFIGLRPVRRAGRVDAGDVVDDDPLASARLADHLEPERALGALLEPTHDGVDRLFERQPLDLLGDLVDLQAQARGR